MTKIVGIGGGTGLPVLLSGLKKLGECSDSGEPFQPLRIAAIVSVSDNGGSSGHLRRSFGVPAVGDLRNCLVALSEDNSMLPDLFQYRFPAGDGLQGHALGNLIVSALCLRSGSLGQAAELASRLLGSTGCVLPATEKAVTLCAEMDSGSLVRGEVQITSARSRIRRIWLEPENPPPSGGVLQAIASADTIVLGPGSLYTSVLPNLLVGGVAEAVRHSHALKIYVCNLMTQPGETARFTATDHLRVLESYLGAGVVDICVLNMHSIKPALRGKYGESESEPVSWNLEEIARMGIVAATADLLAEGRLRVRHDPVKLARLILSLTRGTDRLQDTLYSQTTLVA
ncbi:MAG: uridine diphosphate-N-acetylglucosamine-binding protein YvcK [Acidobacteria bacterium]|nr:uridine diphosphate-N-acetylglucosamine-binding protein YvcK [Acidobacteriota bacterium]